MSPPTNPDHGNKPKRPLPPELAFLTDRPDLTKLEDEELLAFVRNQHALIRQHADLIRAHGMDPDGLIDFTEQPLSAAEEACQDSEASTETMYQAMANSADAQRELFKAMSAFVGKAHEENPFDEKVQEAKEFIEEWSKRMPKE
jgi:hypothetical protein